MAMNQKGRPREKTMMPMKIRCQMIMMTLPEALRSSLIKAWVGITKILPESLQSSAMPLKARFGITKVVRERKWQKMCHRVLEVLAIVQMDRKLRLNMCRQEVKDRQ